MFSKDYQKTYRLTLKRNTQHTCISAAYQMKHVQHSMQQKTIIQSLPLELSQAEIRCCFQVKIQYILTNITYVRDEIEFNSDWIVRSCAQYLMFKQCQSFY